MGLLVCEIMSLPAMKDAAVLAGNAGLYNAVETIGTIDIFECLEHSLEHYETLSLNGHIMLTAMLTGWPIETQCACLSFLKASGASGIILFSLPDHAASIDPFFLQKADELQLPVIRMPEKQWPYSEIINPIINAIIRKENEHFQLSYPTLMKLANVSKEKQSAAFLLETLSRDTMVSIALLDGEFAPQHRAELSQVFTDFFTGPDFRAAAERAAAQGQGEFTGAGGQTIYFSCQQMFLYNSKVRYLVAASNTAPVSAAQQNWIAEVISFFFAAWNINKTGHNSLAISILEEDQVGARSLAKALNIDLNRISIFYLFHPTRRLSQQELDRYYSRIEKYVSQFMSRPVMAKYGTGIAVFLEMPQYPLDIFDFTEELQKELAEYGGEYVLFRHTQEELAYEKFFAAALASMEDARRVYPHKQVFSLQELRFVRACADTVAQGQDSIAQSLEILKPLMKKQNWAGDLWHTLAAYSYIQEIMSGDTEKAKFLQKIFGYSLTGDTRHECMTILYGVTTRNGNVQVEQILLMEINRMLAFVRDRESEFVELLTKKNERDLNRQFRECSRELEHATQRIAKLDSIIQRLYEDNLDGKISDERFAKMTATYEQEQKDLQTRVIVLRETLSKAKAQRLNIDSFLAQVRKYTEVKELDAEIIRALVERIDVFKPEKVPGTRTKKQTILIHWNFIGAVDLPQEEKKSA